ncbi:hypothetical protein M9H77_17501 [Catharanthus roseus]|uniref:Uncharacterized protein n=1 Tax=Catharanthus roseus TaxID=4058 RepID=A0ACC0B4U3_CATRO|nr:hypothetical protein M9H77_17501 [Catharanthus roseus]
MQLTQLELYCFGIRRLQEMWMVLISLNWCKKLGPSTEGYHMPNLYDENNHSDEDYVVSSESESDDNNDAEEEELQTLVNPVIENTVTEWESSTKQAQKYVFKIYFNVNIAPCCQRSRDTYLKHHPRSASIISNWLYIHEVCRENGTRTDTYVPDIYLRETYRRTYQSDFHPVGHEKYWRDAPYNLTFHPPNMNNERGRKQAQDFGGKWIIKIRILSQDVADIACWVIIEKL